MVEPNAAGNTVNFTKKCCGVLLIGRAHCTQCGKSAVVPWSLNRDRSTCSSCGAQIGVNDKFCGDCGQPTVQASYEEAKAASTGVQHDLASVCDAVSSQIMANARDPRTNGISTIRWGDFPRTAPEVLYDGCTALGYCAENLRELLRNGNRGAFDAVVAAANKE